MNPMNVVRATFEVLPRAAMSSFSSFLLQALTTQRHPSVVGAERGMTVLEYRFPDEPPRIVSRHTPALPPVCLVLN